MRPALLALCLAAPVLAGCIAQPAPIASSSVGSLDIASVQVPAGAELVPLEQGAALRWVGVELPLEEEVVIPAGTTMVRLTLEAGAGTPAGVAMSHAESGRRRCNRVPLLAWDVPILGTVSCSGLTAVDALPATWRVAAAAAVAEALLPGEAPQPRIGDVTLELLAVPLDGPVAQLDLSQLSLRTQEAIEPTGAYVESFDGTPLWVEVTLPDGEGPWPVIISSSPYNDGTRPAMWAYFTRDWAERGYAVVNADVRGYGESGGCVEVWGPNEQADQKFLVEWAAEQPWSDGNVGFYGQSYVGTTPVAAAVQAPEALKAIVTIAPVINAYDDWHFGGVPNGESTGSPVAYQVFTGVPAEVRPEDPRTTVLNRANGLCDATLVARANDPRALYDAFYAERNFSARASEVKAAVLYTEGFEDSNVKSSMITHWFNALPGPKLGLFGHWVHQHPTRADQEVLFLAWFDQYLKGKPLGLERLPAVDVVTNAGTHRTADAWPPVEPAWHELGLDFAGRLVAGAPEGEGQILVVPEGLPGLDADGGPLAGTLRFAGDDAAEPLHWAGEARLHLKGRLQGLDNAYVAAFLHDVGPDGGALVTWGMANLAHRAGHDRYEPLTPGAGFEMDLPLLPTEWVLQPGHHLLLEVRGARVSDWSLVEPTRPGVLTLEGGPEGTRLQLPLAPAEGVAPLPVTATP